MVGSLRLFCNEEKIKVPQSRDRVEQVESTLAGVLLPDGIRIRAWPESDFTAIEKLSTAEGWPTPSHRADEALAAFRASWPTLVVTHEGRVIGFLRALTDGQITTYIAEILIAPEWRGEKLGQALVDVCHRLYPSTRLDLLSTESSDGFYEAIGFRRFHGFRKSY